MTVDGYMCQHLQFSVVYPYVKGTRIPSLDQLLVEQYDHDMAFKDKQDLTDENRKFENFSHKFIL